CAIPPPVRFGFQHVRRTCPSPGKRAPQLPTAASLGAASAGRQSRRLSPPASLPPRRQARAPLQTLLPPTRQQTCPMPPQVSQLASFPLSTQRRVGVAQVWLLQQVCPLAPHFSHVPSPPPMPA